MKKLSLQQNISYLICIIITVLIAIAIKPSYPADPRGILLPASQQQFQAISPDRVQLIGQTMPLLPSGTKVGDVNIEMHLSSTQPADIKAATAKVETYAKQLAAKAGANVVLVKSQGWGGNEPLTVYILKGIAIHSN